MTNRVARFVRLSLALLAATAWCEAGFAQASPPPDLPPLEADPLAPGTLPGGTAVSQPLRSAPTIAPGEAVPLPPSPQDTLAPTESVPRNPLPGFWFSASNLEWWSKAQPLPPLVTAARGDTRPILGAPGTELLLGGRRAAVTEADGGRFRYGWTVDPAGRFGFEVDYLVLDTNTAVVGVANSPGVSLGRPVFNATSGQPDALLAAGANVPAEVVATTNTRVQGWEASAVANLYTGEAVTVNAVAGYRYLMVNEGLRVDQTTHTPTAAGGDLDTTAADQIDADTRFHGGQVALRAIGTRGKYFFELDTGVSIGRAVQVVKVSGTTVTTVGGMLPQFFAGGVLGQLSNSGRSERSAFAVLPEGSVKFGVQVGERSRLFVGYSVVYLSSAVRPGDQLDRVFDLTAAGGPQPGDRPAPLFRRWDFWTQGLTAGLEWGY